MPEQGRQGPPADPEEKVSWGQVTEQSLLEEDPTEAVDVPAAVQKELQRLEKAPAIEE